MTFQANEADMKQMFARENRAWIKYRWNIGEKKDFKKGKPVRFIIGLI